jgi:KipI family sensor histidine kinase inhibitor
MRARADAAALDAALLAREAGLERSARRWSRTAHAAALGFVAMLYASPMYWWPELERLRLGFVTMALCAAAVIAHRLSSGERIRLGGGGSLLLLAYLAFIPLSLTWTLSRPDTLRAIVDGAKMAVVFVAIQNALDAPSRLARFLRVAALASLGPALGGVWVWANDDHLVEGFRTHWRGLYGDPNRLAMSLVAVLPFALLGAMRARRPAARVLFAGVVAAQVAAIVLTHSRSGAVAAALAAPPAEVADKGREWCLPACYAPALAEDLGAVAAATGLTPAAVVAAHSGADYRVVMQGFAPGWAYLSGLPAALALPRRASPRDRIPGGSLIIAGGQAIVAALAMPSGWHILGRTPERLFDPSRRPAFLFAPGDRLRFDPVDDATFVALEARAGAGEPLAREEAG